MIRVGAAILLAMGAGLVAPAAAQHMAYVGPGAPDPSSKSVETGQRAGQIRSGFAACVYKRNPRKVRALLMASDPVTINYAPLGYDSAGMMAALDMPACMVTFARGSDAELKFRMDQRSLRAMLAEAAYVSSYPTAPAFLDTLGPPSRQFVSSEATLPAARISADFADCLVRVAPHESDAFLRTLPSSSEEAGAIQRLSIAIPRCVAAGQTVKLNRTALREFVADGLWTASAAAPEKK